MIQKPKGTFDILPEEMPYWQFIEQKSAETITRLGSSSGAVAQT